MDFRIIWKEEVSSTNEALKALIKTGEKKPLLLAANYQSEGKGQFDRTWSSPKGENLLCSLYVPGPIFPSAKAFHISMIAALTVQGVLSELGVATQLKWPNDVLVGEEKICGILIENTIKDQSVAGSIIGIGLNINQTSFEIPGATSVKQVSGDAHEVVHVAAKIAQGLSCWLEDYTENANSLKERYTQNLMGYRYEVKAELNSVQVNCVIQNVLDDGRLIALINDEPMTLMQGDIKLMR